MKIIIIISIVILLFSCNQIEGRIEVREGGKAYLVNGSKTKEFNFTVKTTIIINDSLYDYQTHVIPLIAGGEVYLSKVDSVSPIEYPLIDSKRDSTHDPLGILVAKIPDSAHPLPITKYSYKYEVTGQNKSRGISDKYSVSKP